MTDPHSRASRDDAEVTASEVASYAFCAKAWHLERARGRAPSERAVARRAKGATRHEAHGAKVLAARRSGTRLVAWTVLLLAVAVILALVALVLSRH